MRSLPYSAVLMLVPMALSAQGPAAPSTPTPVVPAPATTLPRTRAPKPTKADITAEDLMTRLYIFADDSMQGREAGTAGNVKGTDYIASEVKRLKLVPMGDNGTYFQTLPFKTRSIDSTSALTAGGTALVYGTDWAARGTASVAKSDLAVVYGGSVSDTTTLPADQVSGKLVVFMLPQGGGNRSMRGVVRRAPSALAIGLIVPEQLVGLFRRPATFIDDPANPPPALAVPPSIVFTQAGAAKLFDAPLDQLTIGGAGKPVSLELKVVVAPTPFPARNVVAVLPGSDKNLKGQYVAIGAHNDHIGMNGVAVDHDSMRIFLHEVRPGGRRRRR